MNQVLFEGRFLINIISILLHKSALQVRYGRMDWERLFRMADYHRIANMIYLGMLGNGGRVPDKWQNRFFERYQEALLSGENCETAEKEILALLDAENVPSVVLSSTTLRELYEIPETADLSPLRLYLSPEGYTLTKGYLVDLGYETIRSYPEFGERMYRPAGLCVDIYHKLPFKTRFYEKHMRELAIRSHIRNEGKSVRILSPEDRFLFRLASVAYQYVRDELLIRDMLDLFLYHRAWRKHLNNAYVQRRLQDFNTDGLADRLLRLSYMWFGVKEDRDYMQANGQAIEDPSSFDVMESRILTRGEVGKERESDPQALALAKLLKKEEDREYRKARLQRFKRKAAEKKKAIGRFMRWAFPEYKYMTALYPILEKLPILLPFCWVFRGLRLLLGMLKNGSRRS